MMKRLAVITTHPIQYYAPWFKLLAEKKTIDLKVFYTWEQSKTGEKFDPGFGKKFTWDIPLLEGYEYTFVKNTSAKPGSHHFNGIINPSLIEEIKAWNPDAILVIGWNFRSHLKCIRYFKGKIPVLFRGDSTILNKSNPLKKMLRRFFLSWVYSHIDYAFYVGTNNKEYYLNNGLKDEQLIFAPHAIDNFRYSDSDNNYEKTALEWRKKLGVQDDETVVLFAGKLEPVKNPFLILTLAEKINNSKVKFVLVGNGMLEDELKSRAAQRPNVLFLDFQNQQNMPVIYRIADIFILPSHSETWGLAVNEAMASSRPVIISNKVGCGKDLVKNNINGLIFNEDDPESIINFLNALTSNKESINQMGKESAKIVKEFSFEHIIDAIENLVIQL